MTFTRHRLSDASVNDSGLCVDSRSLRAMYRLGLSGHGFATQAASLRVAA
ncbi:MAG: hypothetical protein VB143_05740 [Burkholderia sp.]